MEILGNVIERLWAIILFGSLLFGLAWYLGRN